MIPKKLKLKTEDFNKLYTNLFNGEFLNIKVHYINKNNIINNIKQYDKQKESNLNKEQKESNLKIENRYGVVISKKISKSAVQRNKLKRLLFFVIQNILKNKDNNKLKDKEIKDIISKPCLSILNIMLKKNQLERIASNKGFIYFLKKTQKQKIEKIQILEAKKASMPSDIDAIHILVALIQNPNSLPADLSLLLKDKISCNLDSITTLFQHFGLEKNGRSINKALVGYLKIILNGISVETLFHLPSDLIRQFDLTENLKQLGGSLHCMSSDSSTEKFPGA